MKNVVSPDKPRDRTFDELVTLLKDHLNPRPIEIVQRFGFKSRVRQANESIGEYAAHLWKLAHDCSYGTTLNKCYVTD